MKSNKILWLVILATVITSILHLLARMGIAIDPQILMATRWLTVGTLCLFGIRNSSLTTWILISMAVGFEIGLDMGKPAKDFDVLSSIFIQLIKTVVGPLIFSTLVIGIASQSSSRQMGRIAAKAFAYFLAATSIALVVGLVAINVTKAGMNIHRESDDKVMAPASDFLVKVNTKKKKDNCTISKETPLRCRLLRLISN